MRTYIAIATVVLGTILGPGAWALQQAPSEMNIAIGTSAITAGSSTSVSGMLTSNGLPAGTLPVALWGFEYAGAWRQLTSATTDPQGRVTVTVAPQRRTTYQWRFAGDGEHAATLSPTARADVATLVTMQLRSTFISSGQRAILTGTTTPPRPGVTVNVYSITISGRTSKWFSGRTRDNGSYRLSHRVPTGGKWRLYAAVGAGGGNLGGHSPLRDLYVR